MTSGSVLLLQSAAKLPVELAMERQLRAARIQPAKFDLASLPQVRVPYRMWRSPALDFVVSAGVTYRAKDGMRVDRQIVHLCRGRDRASVLRRPNQHRPEGPAVGVAAARLPLRSRRPFARTRARHPFRRRRRRRFRQQVERLVGVRPRGRDHQPAAECADGVRPFALRGRSAPGWEAEIYRNDELLGFAKATSDNRYVFDDVQLLYGENRVRVVLYGPQGQIRTREELINVGQDNVPPGKTWYWAGFNQPGRDVFTLHKPPDGGDLPTAQATVSLEHGIDDRTSVAALARMMLIDDQRVTFVEGTVRRSIGLAMIEVGAARETTGGTAARAQLLGKIGPVNVNAEALIANDFHLRGGTAESLRNYQLALDAPLKFGRTTLPAHADVRLADRGGGTKQLDAAARLSASLERFNLSTGVRYRKQYVAGARSAGEFSLEFIGSGRVGDVRLRGTTDVDVSPTARLRSAELSAYWSASENADWEGDLVYDTASHQGRARISHIRRLNSMAIALTGEAATDGSVAIGVNLNFSLDPMRGFTMSRRPLAQAGSVHAIVYRDLNDNGARDPDEPLEKGALITTGTKQADRPTDAKGSVTVAGLGTYIPVAVGIDETSLADPMLVPKKALQVVVPRPGVPAEVQIGLVGGGDIEGAIVKSGGLGFEGLDLELVDVTGKVVATARTDFDGFFLFERVAYGNYTAAGPKESAAAAKVLAELGVRITVTPDKSIVRLGAIQVRPQPVLAANGAVPANP